MAQQPLRAGRRDRSGETYSAAGGNAGGIVLGAVPLLPLVKAGAKPIVAMPNPFYQCYAAPRWRQGPNRCTSPPPRLAAFRPTMPAFRKNVLERIAAVYICSPSNPEGAVASEAYWKNLFALAERHDFIVLADECYADIYFGLAPLTALPIRLKQAKDFSRLLTFHSLSKRSGLPGLRSGPGGGLSRTDRKIPRLRNVAGPTVPGPVLAASAAALRDEAHVAANRAGYAEKMAAAENILGNRMRRPEGGFFLWLKTQNGEETALRLWREQGVRVLPGPIWAAKLRRENPSQTPAFLYPGRPC